MRRSAALAFAALALAACARPAPPPPKPHASAPPRDNPDLAYSAAELDAFARDYVQGYEATGKLSAKLESFEPLTVNVERGRCYRIVFRFGDDVTLSAKARRRLSTGVLVPGDKGTIMGSKIHGPGGVAPAGCPQTSGAAKIDLFPAGSEEWRREHDLGQGTVSFEIWSKPVSDAELAAMAQDTERQRQAARESEKQGCAQCRREKDLCLDGRRRPTTGSCVSDYDSCVFRSGLGRGTCD